MRLSPQLPAHALAFLVLAPLASAQIGTSGARNQFSLGPGCVANAGFETGDVSGWNLVDFGVPFVPAGVAPAGFDPGFGLFTSAPTEGSFSFIHGFDADGPSVLTLSQEIAVDPLVTPFTFDWRAGWEMDGFPGSTLNRTFDVVVRDASTSAELERTNILTAGAGTAVDDTGQNRGVVDLAPFVGQTILLSLEWTVPESFTGPGFFELDNVACPLVGGPIGVNYCSPGNSNSTGESARISAFGSPVVAMNAISLVAEGLPAGSFGFFLASRDRGFVFNPGGSLGILCLGGEVGRYDLPGQILNAGPSGTITLPLDLTMTPQPTGFVPVVAGESWNFQGWYRDSFSGSAVSNLSDGTTVSFF